MRSNRLELQICNSAHKCVSVCYNGIVSRRADNNDENNQSDYANEKENEL